MLSEMTILYLSVYMYTQYYLSFCIYVHTVLSTFLYICTQYSCIHLKKGLKYMLDLQITQAVTVQLCSDKKRLFI